MKNDDIINDRAYHGKCTIVNLRNCTEERPYSEIPRSLCTDIVDL